MQGFSVKIIDEMLSEYFALALKPNVVKVTCFAL